MDILKRLLGIVWILMALALGYFGTVEIAWPKLFSGKQDDLVFGIIILFVLLPITVGGLGLFGWFSLRGEYNEPENAE